MKKTVVVHSALIDGGNFSTPGGGHSSIALFYLARGYDDNGSGWADIDVQASAQLLGKSPVTVKRYIGQGRKHGWLRGTEKRGGGVIRVYYSALHKVALSKGLDDWGAAVEVELSELGGATKLLVTQAEAQSLQKASRFQASRRHKRRGVATPKEILYPSSHQSRGERGDILQYGHRTTYVSADFVPYGGSQNSVAKRMGRSRRTITRRLQNEYRMNRGQPALMRKQLAQNSNAATVSFLDKIHSQRVFISRSLAFVALCNIYSEDLDLRSQRFSRKKYKFLLKRSRS